MSDNKTIAVYDARVRDYANISSSSEPDADLQAFIGATTPGGHVLDLGCGPGRSAAMLRKAGFSVTATDASAEMVQFARDTFEIDAVQATFDEITGTDIYDGIWANFSLLHAAKSDMPRHLAALREALKSGGVFHIGTKVGDGEARDSIGRKYSYYQEDELHTFLTTAGFMPRTTRHGAEKGLDGTVAPFMIVLADG